jgi:feruloyl-CoA synthase
MDMKAQRPLSDYPMRVLDRPERRISIRNGADGIVYLSSGYELAEQRPLLIDYLERAATLRPDTTFLAERDGSGAWRRLTYAQAWRDTAAVATWLIRQGHGPQSASLMILSDNSVEHGVLMMGALRAGVAVVPISPAYSLSAHLGRLEYALELIDPALVYAQDAKRYAAALALAKEQGRQILSSEGFAELLGATDDAALSERRAQITSDTIAKILLTSGSTGKPKGVVNTHGNLAAATRMVKQVTEPFKLERVNTYVDWLPWNHAFGGNAQFNLILANAGSLYIDSGRPLPDQFQATIENLREISPTGYGCVPAVYGLLADALERDADLRHKFFKNMRWLSYGGALLPQPLWERMQWLAVQELGERLPFGTGWGMTETVAAGVGIHWNTERTGLIGLPLPGVTVKLVPAGERMEMRIKGPHVMPCYYKNEALNAVAFDEEGFFCTGDAVRWVDPQEPIEGLDFAGRITEDFKLLSGTWVQTSLVRRDLVDALQPLVLDAVICAPDRPWLGALVWLNVKEDDAVRTALARKLAAFNASRNGGASTIARMLVLAQPPSSEAGEITDKRSINQRCVMERRADQVQVLYAEPVDARLVLPQP